MKFIIRNNWRVKHSKTVNYNVKWYHVTITNNFLSASSSAWSNNLFFGYSWLLNWHANYLRDEKLWN